MKPWMQEVNDTLILAEALAKLAVREAEVTLSKGGVTVIVRVKK